MRFLEVGSEISVFGDICKKLEGHEDVVFPRHGWENDLLGGIVDNKTRELGWWLDVDRVCIVTVDNLREAYSLIGSVGWIHDASIDRGSVGNIECLSLLPIGSCLRLDRHWGVIRLDKRVRRADGNDTSLNIYNWFISAFNTS
ncbi:hypothetical protein ABW19_dt0204786 [Dactylella cylindrospora]|nr:hypothetical protein ABW19_dt0204786 [Dactylella cylindrospora]